MRGPHPVRQHRELVGARPGVRLAEAAADERLAAERREERRRDREPAQLLRLPVRGEADGAEREEGRVFDGLGLALPVQIVRNRHARLRQAHQRVAVPDEHEAVGGRVRQRAQQHLIQQAEDGGIGANPERQRQDGDEREDRLLAQRAQRVSDVLHGEWLDGLDARRVVKAGRYSG